MIKKSNKLNKGFTLVETLVAISIFTVSIVALMSVLASGISDTNYAKRKITAEYLAQEGIEYMRNMRDTYVLYSDVPPNNDWDTFKSALSDASCDSDTGCYFDDQSMTVAVCGQVAKLNDSSSLLAKAIEIIPIDASACPSLFYDEATGEYGYGNGGIDSGFIRKIFTQTISPEVVKIYSIISWAQGSGDYSVTFSESLFNWTE